MSSALLSSLSRITAAARLKSSENPDSSVSASRMLRTVSFALLVGISYYVGTRIGFALTPIGQPNSTFWPPNAILLAAFLLAPRRTWWWMFLLAVLPAHLIAQSQAGVPVWTALGWFVTNTSEALIGAYFIRRISPESTLDSVRGVLSFVIFGVLVAPLATSFLDASAVVLTGWGRGYWPLSIERFWTNALAELTIVPSIVLCGSDSFFRICRIRVPRLFEAAILIIATLSITVLLFRMQSWSPATAPALLYVPLPLFLWAAARFGLRGLSLSLLSVALISMWYTMRGREPFPYASMPQNVLSLQILLCVVAVPLMFLSAVMAEARRTQESLHRMSSSLIAAQEQERARIGRELHDDINQRLAMLSVELEQLQENPSEVQSRVDELRKRTTEISNDVQALSHDLHSSRLEYLGVVAGIKSWCKEFAERQDMTIDFKSDVASDLPIEVGLTVFRVLQEALHNVVKHSGVRRVEVTLRLESGEIYLIVSDLGKGFDVEAALQGKGLGLTSMRERARLVNGTIAIDSTPMGGTRIHVRLPLQSQHAA
ncbi:MAG TPA: MASE1 domain-containing protein [Terriglobales bacterium]|nr:MASE1 domain-containing protein [Terriglobales bacterium]